MDPKKFYGTLQYAADIESDESDDPDLCGDDAESGVHSKIQTNQNDPDSESDYSSDDDLPLSEIQRRISKNIEWHEEVIRIRMKKKRGPTKEIPQQETSQKMTNILPDDELINHVLQPLEANDHEDCEDDLPDNPKGSISHGEAEDML
ncbi:unnamed protein product [Acanthoscelides obtectus]|uniref:Uncharacterized protein n=1 Tax=Acanthoscelides obtectus TaxID=200917 RepID=A0A9P0PLY4_ACAOB|nr:unnamed protein product [Acanthoscelides obtectus]CAK1627371.1 hypothetical protein AOBTE_LOCUS4555 [Acanthoscelides obtectus]